MAEFVSPRFADDPDLVRILNAPDDGSDRLTPGMRSDAVCRVQQALFDMGWAEIGLPMEGFVTSLYAERTTDAVLRYKTYYDIHFPPEAPTGDYDGLCGPRTLARLDAHCVVFDAGTAATDAKVRELTDFGLSVVPGPIISLMTDEAGTVRSATIDGTDGAIYFLGGVGAFEVHGAILQDYLDTHGGPVGDLGYPISDEYGLGIGIRRSDFQAGSLQYDFSTGLVTLLEPFFGVGPTVVSVSGFPDRIAVKFADDLPIPYVDGVEQYLLPILGDPLQSLLDRFPFLTFTRAFTSVEPEVMEAWQSSLPGDADVPRLASWFSVEAPAGIGVDASWLAETIYQALGPVEAAYPQPPVSLASVDASDDPLAVEQQHLDAAPGGIDARAAWTRFGGDGAGVHVIDLERDWRLDHEDLVHAAAQFIQGRRSQTPGDIDHGTGVLGLLLGGDNAVGGVGVVPNVRCSLASTLRSSDGREDHADALLLLAVGALSGAPTVVLLEAQIGLDSRGDPLRPLESDPLLNGLIRGLVATGVVVVEAAGNGSIDLDLFATAQGHASTRANDTGAIMVGAGLDPLGEFTCGARPRQRSFFSNYGSRVDCWAQGHALTTATSADAAAGPTRGYTRRFGGTSGASAIIAGAAAALLGAAQVAGVPLGSGEVRALLSDPALNTPSAVPGRDRIGVMPDLAAILASKGL